MDIPDFRGKMFVRYRFSNLMTCLGEEPCRGNIWLHTGKRPPFPNYQLRPVSCTLKAVCHNASQTQKLLGYTEVFEHAIINIFIA